MTPQDLKNSILQLAMQGKLVEQRAEEGTAEELYQQIQEEKAKLIKAGKIKKEKSLLEISEEEVPFDIPDSWKWVRFGSVIQMINGDRGKNYPSKDKLSNTGSIPFISAVNMNNNTIVSDGLLYVSEEQFNLLGSGKLQKGDLVLCIRGSLGKNAIYPFEKGAIASSLVIVRSFIREKILYDFISYYFDTPLFVAEINRYNNGTAQPNLGARDLAKFMLPLPSLAEQERIVAKIEELLPLVEQYGKAYDNLESFNTRFPEDMKKSILQYAMQGKLVEQRAEEGTAEELYRQIQQEKAELIKAGKIKKEKPLADITEDEIPFDIPDSWKWVRLAEIGLLQTGTTPSRTHSEYFGDAIPFLSPGDILNGKITYGMQGLSELGKTVARVVEPYSILQVCIGGAIGKAAIVDRKITFNQQINSISLYLVDYKYVYFAMISDLFVKAIRSNATGTATPIINKSVWGNLLVPLPPLKEQKRIVAKIEELLPYCECLMK